MEDYYRDKGSKVKRMYIDKKSPIPVYYQLKKIITDKISSGVYAVESLIPSERELSEILNISRMTVRQALSQLVTDGVLYREKGKGTFVSKPKFEQRNIMSFSDIAKEKGLVPSTTVLSFYKSFPDQSIAGMLDIRSDESIYTIKRLRLANNLPIGIEEVFIPERYCPNLENFDLSASLYKLLKENFHHSINYVDNSIEAAKPSKEEKELLCISSSTPVLNITSIYFMESELKLLYEKSIYRSDEYIYNVRVYGSKNME